jgi:hypothetical protein
MYDVNYVTFNLNIIIFLSVKKDFQNVFFIPISLSLFFMVQFLISKESEIILSELTMLFVQLSLGVSFL